MAKSKDPTKALCKQAAKLADSESMACNQTGYKVNNKAFLYIGPGAKGVGFKAMFKLDGSMAKAKKLAKTKPDCFEVGKTGWVTCRFTADEPLEDSIWKAWLVESHAICNVAKSANKKTKAPPKKKAAKKKSVKKKPRR